MEGIHLKNWSNEDRLFSKEEKQWLDKMLSIDFEGRDILKNQLNSAKVIGSCECGCKTIDIQTDTSLQPFPYSERVPVEMYVRLRDEKPIVFYLHVVNGYVTELEVFAADSSPINKKIDIKNARVELIKN